MYESSHRSKVIQLFEKHRAIPGAPYDEDHFLDFLLANPEKTRAVYDSFRGLKRFNAFIDDVQYEFAICFSLKDREANYALTQFVDRVIELQRSRRGSLASLKNQAGAGSGWRVLIIANFALLIAGIWLKSSSGAIAALTGVAVLLNAWFIRFAWRANAYLEKLRSRIEAAEPKP